MHGQFRGFLKDDGDEFEDEGRLFSAGEVSWINMC